MKKRWWSILLIVLAMVPCLCCAEMNIKLVWEYSYPEIITGYKVYSSNVSGEYDPNNPVSVVEDPNIMFIEIRNLPDAIYYFVVTAFFTNGEYVESSYSNEVNNLFAPKVKKCFGIL